MATVICVRNVEQTHTSAKPTKIVRGVVSNLFGYEHAIDPDPRDPIHNGKPTDNHTTRIGHVDSINSGSRIQPTDRVEQRHDNH